MDVPGPDTRLNIELVLNLETDTNFGCTYENTFTFVTWKTKKISDFVLGDPQVHTSGLFV